MRPPIYASLISKVERAEHHLSDVRNMTNTYRRYVLVPEQCADDPDEVAFRIRFRPLPSELSAVVGDCIHNLRCALDHIVWQIADKYAPGRPAADKKRNMFPLSATPGEFADQVARKRLNGLPDEAQWVVESLQPYNEGGNAMLILGELENIDKHRALILVSSVTAHASVETFRKHGLTPPHGDDHWYRDGDIFMQIHRRFVPTTFRNFGEVEEEATGIVEAAFADPPATGWKVHDTLRYLTVAVRHTVVPSFQPFF